MTMSAAITAATIHAELLRTLCRATSTSGKNDGWFAERIGCGREHFNKARHGKAQLNSLQLVMWGCLVGVPVVGVAVEPQQAEAAE